MTLVYIRHVPTIGFHRLQNGTFVADWKQATHYTFEESTTLAPLFPDERWVCYAL